MHKDPHVDWFYLIALWVAIALLIVLVGKAWEIWFY